MATAIDPICKMEVNTSNPSGCRSEYQDANYYFCAPGCKVAFDQDPKKYLAEDWQGMPMGPGTKRRSFLSRLFGR